MPTRRESIMAMALPAIEAHVRARRTEGGSAAVATALGTRSPTGADEPWAEVEERVYLEEEDLEALEGGASVESRPAVRDLAWNVLAAGNRALFALLVDSLDLQDEPDGATGRLRDRVAAVKRSLDVDAVDVFAQRVTRRRILEVRALRKGLVATLGGGSIVPVVEIDEATALVIPHQSGLVAVEVRKELSVQYDDADGGRVEVTATEDFRLIAFAAVPARRVVVP